MIITRAWAMPNKWTFDIKPIRELIIRYVGSGIGWADPFCGKSEIAEYRNDLNPEFEGCSHMLAVEFCKLLPSNLKGLLFDPPYSGRQVSECYKHLKNKVHMDDTNAYFYSSVMTVISPKMPVGSHVISFGWQSNGFGKIRGFECIEILLVAHGGHHNDTICTVERKLP